MGRGDRRNRKISIPPMPELAPTRKREKNTQYRRSESTDRSPASTALKARARQMGVEETRQGQTIMQSQYMECDQGRVIYMLHKGDGDKIARLWGTYSRLDAAEEAYVRRYIGGARFAKTAKIEMAPERFEALPDESNDLRTPDEKDRDAVSTWMRWQGYLGHLSAGQQTIIQQALRHTGGKLIYDRQPTDTGKAFVIALAALADVAERR